jgi:hypothetical protein
VISVVIDNNFKVHIHVFGRKIDDSHFIWKQVPDAVKSVQDVQCLLELFAQLHFCTAVTDKSLLMLVPAGGVDGAVRSKSWPIKDSVDCFTVRAVKCAVLLKSGIRCMACTAIQKKLLMRRRRSVAAVTKCHSFNLLNYKRNNSYLSSPLKMKKLRMLALRHKGHVKKVLNLESKLAEYEQTSRKLITDEGEKLNASDCDSMTEIANDCTSIFLHL